MIKSHVDRAAIKFLYVAQTTEKTGAPADFLEIKKCFIKNIWSYEKNKFIFATQNKNINRTQCNT